VLRRSRYPSFEVAEEYVDEAGNEVRVQFPGRPARLGAFLGVDIGSTSTKVAMMDEDGRVWCDVYRATGGDPLGAASSVLLALHRLVEERGVSLEVLGLGTTGSGRSLVGRVLGADVIINEITAHAKGALATAPEGTETIFEIGGQDAKYIRVSEGQIRDSNMNFVCSAGTGSFVEEQARKLGFRVREVGAVTEGLAPPATSDRCTVFMEQDVARLLADGSTPAEAMAAVHYSVVKNYLNKVVGNRPVSADRVVFQGATARNRGLVAAFENLLGCEVVVSPHCHVMGSIGACLVVRERAGGRSSFVGFEHLADPVEIRHDQCRMCTNFCRLTHASAPASGREVSWGYMCGREPDEPAQPVAGERGFRYLSRLLSQAMGETVRTARPEAPVIGLPRSLSTYGLAGFWSGFWGHLGCRLTMDGATDDEVKELGASLSAADFCFPVKAHLGHIARRCADPEVDWVLVPFFISETPNPQTSNSLVCPYVESSPSVYRSVASPEERARLLSPVLDFRWSARRQAAELYRHFKALLPGLTSGTVLKALAAGHARQERFSREAVEEGERLLAAAREAATPVFVVVGRPYNVRDEGLNLAIPRQFARLGCTVIPYEMLPFRPELLGEEFSNIYWTYGQRILSALKQVGDQPDLYAVYLSNFNCGPDSFLLTYAEEILRDKPFLVLELDEHGAEGGYVTRIEAFLDVVEGAKSNLSRRRIRTFRVPAEEFRRRKVWMPALHPISARLLASVFRHHGYEAEVLPLEDGASFEIGRRVTRGSECLPTCSTIGRFLKTMEEQELDPSRQTFFMATASGPCRFGQYELLHRMVLDQAGYHDVAIISPSSMNSYQGLNESLRRMAWKGVLISDLLYKARCKTAPYESEPGAADAALEIATRAFERAIEKGEPLPELLASRIADFARIPRRAVDKPLVGIVGEIYVRCNPFTNENLVRAIEEYGGEAWLAPVSEWFLYTTQKQAWLASEGLNGLAARGVSVLKNRFVTKAEEMWYETAGPFLADRHEPSMKKVLKAGMEHLPLNFEGEAIITVGRAVLFARQNVDMVVNAAPFGCMPGTLTTAILRGLQEQLGIPVVGMFYDGTPGLNRVLQPFLEGLRTRSR